MVDTMVVVADGARARFFSTEPEMEELTELRELKNGHHAPAHRRHGQEGHDSGHHAEESRFAAQLAAEVAGAVGRNEVRDVVLVGPARFLSEIAAAMPKAAAARVTATVRKDLTKLERHELGRRLRVALAALHLDDAR